MECDMNCYLTQYFSVNKKGDHFAQPTGTLSQQSAGTLLAGLSKVHFSTIEQTCPHNVRICTTVVPNRNYSDWLE